jgi:hypothetical protein
MPLRHALTRFTLAAAIVHSLAPGTVVAQTSDPSPESREELDRKYVLGIAVGLEHFDTTLKITHKESGRPIFIDAEENFGLPEEQLIPILYGAARLNKKHSLGFHAFRINRVGDRIQVNGNFGALYIDGKVVVSDRSSFSYFNYNYRLLDNEKTRLRAMLGIYLVDLQIEFEATGDIRINDQPVVTRQYTESVRQLTPLPLVGLDLWTTISKRWVAGAKLTMIKGSYDGVSAFVVDAAIRARFNWTDRLSIITGINYLNADVTIDKSKSVQDVHYGYDGIYLGLDFNF